MEYQTIGRRKEAVARLRMIEGGGKVVINDKDFQAYFSRRDLKQRVLSPLKLCEQEGRMNLKINVDGGGVTGQAEAIRLAIARALEEYDSSLRGKLKTAGFLTRDARVKERKKYGRAGARRGYQFSKR